MQSGWVLHFLDGTKKILTEGEYKEYRKPSDNPVVHSEYWEDIECAKKGYNL
jgi:hypothetical protein